MGEHLAKYTAGFKDIIDEHLIRLGYGVDKRQSALFTLTKISAGQINDWINGVRLPGRDRICEICFCLADAYKKKREELEKAHQEVPPKLKHIGPETLDGMLNEMLEAVGYSPAIGAKSHPDQIWHRLAGSDQKELTVAWVEYPPFAYRDGAGRRGVAIDITERVAKLMGVRFEWKHKEWPQIISSLMNREVDMIAPLLAELPSRMFQMAFSSEIPGVAVGISGVVNRAFEAQIKSNGLCLNYVKGEAGEAMCTLFAPDALARRGHETFEGVLQHIQKNGNDEEGRVNCLVADNVICQELESSTGSVLKKVESSDVGGSETVTIPIAAGIHLQERQLLHVVNECLKILQATKWFDTYWQKGDGQKLMGMLGRPAPPTKPPPSEPIPIEDGKRPTKSAKVGKN
jgi:hypothetical protein